MHTEPQDSWAIVLLRSQESGSNAGGKSTLHTCIQLFIFSSNRYSVFGYPASIAELAAVWLTNEAVESITQVSCSFRNFWIG